MYKLKSILFGLITVTALTVFLTSCEKEILNEEYSQIESNTDTSNLYDEGLQASLLNPTPIVLSDYYGDFTKTKVEAFIRDASEIDVNNYKKNYVIAEYLLKKKIINADNYKEWTNQSLYDLDLKKYLNEEEITSLNLKIDRTIQKDNDLNKKASCSWSSYTVGYICHGFFGICWPVTASAYNCSSNTVVLYEGNNLSQDLTGVLDVHYNQNINFKSNSCCPNDETRSIQLWNMKAGQDIMLFDDSNPTGTYSDTKDDYIRIHIKRNFTERHLNTLEYRNSNGNRESGYLVNNSYWSAYYARGGNLDGKVSYFKCRN